MGITDFNRENDKVQASKNQYANVRVGDIITFGNYRQECGEGFDELIWKPIEWIVLDVEEDRLFLLSRYVLDEALYHLEPPEEVTWENCTLRWGWLPGVFYRDAFSEDEKNRIMETLVVNDDNLNTPGGNDTMDKVFLLSKKEVETYLNGQLKFDGIYRCWSEKLIAEPTPYAMEIGVNHHKITEKDYEKELKGKNYSRDVIGCDGACWWLRTPGIAPKYACFVDGYGAINVAGDGVCVGGNGVRPALYLRR